MLKNLLILLLLLLGLSACNKNSTQGCTMACTAQYVYNYYGIILTDSKNPDAKFINISVINQRTNKPVVLPLYPPNIDFVAGFLLIAANDNKGEFSTGGDNIRITATNAVTNQTKSAVIRISGGCNCSVAKISGPDKLEF
ncbi:hypothetical protein [Mucilaginibacter sp.]|uniref:hypothetical protein n=1 Tax=Mucilaginibacter sp. TaxID=1882438 RepID=UPI0035BBFEB9